MELLCLVAVRTSAVASRPLLDDCPMVANARTVCDKCVVTHQNARSGVVLLMLPIAIAITFFSIANHEAAKYFCCSCERESRIYKNKK